MKEKKRKKYKPLPGLPVTNSNDPQRHGREKILPPLQPLPPSPQQSEKVPEHTHHQSKEEKRFKHYVFDFLMLFLAVVAGFFVDNEREHLVEVQREKQFLHSMSDDLRADIHQMDSLLLLRRQKQVMIDSL